MKTEVTPLAHTSQVCPSPPLLFFKTLQINSLLQQLFTCEIWLKSCPDRINSSCALLSLAPGRCAWIFLAKTARFTRNQAAPSRETA